MDDVELALDDCLQRLAAGTSSLGQCLARYPQYAAELRPLLVTALQLQQGRQLRPSGAMRDRARVKLARHMDSHPRRRKSRPIPRLAFAMAALALAVLTAGTAFAQTALPGQTLYDLKLSTERIWRAASSDPMAVDLSLADRRADELVIIAGDQSRNAGDKDAESVGIAAYTDVLDRLAAEADGPDSEHVLSVLELHQQKLSQAGVHVPELDKIVEHGKSEKGPGKKP